MVVSDEGTLFGNQNVMICLRVKQWSWVLSEDMSEDIVYWRYQGQYTLGTLGTMKKQMYQICVQILS